MSGIEGVGGRRVPGSVWLTVSFSWWVRDPRPARRTLLVIRRKLGTVHVRVENERLGSAWIIKKEDKWIPI